MMRLPPRSRRKSVGGSEGGSEGQKGELRRTPVASRGEGRAHTAHVHLEKLALLPGEVSDAGGVERDVDEHRAEDEGREVLVETRSVIGQNAASSLGKVVERDGGHDERGGHARDGDAGHTTATDLVDDDEGDDSEDEVDDGDDHTDDERVVEADGFEESRGVVHQRIESVEAEGKHQSRTHEGGEEATHPQSC